MNKIVFSLLCGLSFLTAQAGEWMPLWDVSKLPGDKCAGTQDQMDGKEYASCITMPSIQVFEPKEASGNPRPALVICPGGGYSVLSMDKEGTAVADWATSHGMVAILLKYRVSNDPKQQLKFPVPIIDVRRAIRTVRHDAQKWNVDPKKIGVIGFSAGGHLAAMAATTWGSPLPLETKDEIDACSARPDFSLLMYPVISMNRSYCHAGTRNTILPEKADQELIDFCTPALQVTKDTAPVFVLQACDDQVVPAENALDMVRACIEKKVPVGMHLYPVGGHGFGMNKRNLPIDDWGVHAIQWIQNLK